MSDQQMKSMKNDLVNGEHFVGRIKQDGLRRSSTRMVSAAQYTQEVFLLIACLNDIALIRGKAIMYFLIATMYIIFRVSAN